MRRDGLQQVHRVHCDRRNAEQNDEAVETEQETAGTGLLFPPPAAQYIQLALHQIVANLSLGGPRLALLLAQQQSKIPATCWQLHDLPKRTKAISSPLGVF